LRLFTFEAIATGTAFRILITGIANVNLTERTIIAGAVILTIRNAATDAGVHFLIVLIHHPKNPPF
jgi:hypothetical protein